MINKDDIISLQDGATHIKVSEELQKLKASLYKTTEPPTYHEFLYLLLKMINPKVVVELGTFDGLSMLYMLESCPDAQFYTIDINPKSGKYLKNKKVTRIIGDAAKCANQIPNDIDFIFEDTDHEYDTIDREFKAYYPKLKYDGVMVFDDMNHMLCPGATKWWRELWWNKVYLNTPTSCAKFSLPKIHPGYGMTAIIKRD